MPKHGCASLAKAVQDGKAASPGAHAARSQLGARWSRSGAQMAQGALPTAAPPDRARSIPPVSQGDFHPDRSSRRSKSKDAAARYGEVRGLSPLWQNRGKVAVLSKPRSTRGQAPPWHKPVFSAGSTTIPQAFWPSTDFQKCSHHHDPSEMDLVILRALLPNTHPPRPKGRLASRVTHSHYAGAPASPGCSPAGQQRSPWGPRAGRLNRAVDAVPLPHDTVSKWP